MLAFRHLKGYFRETTVHGFRYVVEGYNIFERLLWCVLIATSFVLAGYLVKENLNDVANNPMATSINTISINDVPFPAITLSGTYYFHAYRFIETILNTFDFDCTLGQDRDECLVKTKNIRSDFAPFIEASVDRAIYRNMKEMRDSKNTMGRYHMIRYHFCDFTNSMGLKSLSYGIAKSHTKSNDITKLRADLVKAIADNFRHPMEDTRDAMVRVVKKHDPEYEYKKRIDYNDCRKMFSDANYSDVTVMFASTMMHASGVDDLRRPIRLGTLMTRPTLNKLLKSYSDLAFTDNTYHKLAKAYSDLIGNSSIISSKDIYRAFINEAMELPHMYADQNMENDCVLDEELMLFLFATDEETVQFCTMDNSSACCQYERVISKEYVSVLRLLKYTMAPIGREIQRISELKEFKKMIDHMGYKHDSKIADNEDPAILGCKYDGGGLKRNCNLFANMHTTAGIGYTFNSARFWSLYQNTTDNFAFYKEIYQSQNENENMLPRNILSNGKGFSLEFVVNHGKIPNKSKPKMSFHDPNSIADIRNEAYELEPGMLYDMYVTPSVTVTDKHALNLDPTQRHCLAHHESEPLDIFKSYSQSTCFFECQLRMANNFCNCTPWNYPRLSENVTICLGEVASVCFEKQMEISISPTVCDCPNNCNSVQYTVSSMVKPLPSPYICEGSGFAPEQAFAIKVRKQLMWDNEFYSIKRLITPDYVDRCKEKVAESVTFVRVSVAPKTVSQIVRTTRVTFSGQLASLGGILGLFSGMSILSLAEIVFWMLRLIKSHFNKS